MKLNKAASDAIKNEEALAGVGSSDGFWYDLTQGGYFEPEDVLADAKEVAKVKKAIAIVQELESIYKQVAPEF